MEKRVLIAVVLSIAVMYGYSILFPPPQQLQPDKRPVPAVSEQISSAPVKDISLPGALPSQGPVKVAGAAHDVTVENDVFKAEFSTLGGALKKLTLKRYKDQVGPGGKEIILINESNQSLFTLSSEYPGFASSPIQYSVSSANLILSGAEKRCSYHKALYVQRVRLWNCPG